MSILNSASSKSVYRGYEYYKNNNVITYTQISYYEYEGYVKGSKKEPYHVMINTKHPKNHLVIVHLLRVIPYVNIWLVCFF